MKWLLVSFLMVYGFVAIMMLTFTLAIFGRVKWDNYLAAALWPLGLVVTQSRGLYEAIRPKREE